MSKLTDKQKMFCLEYLIDLNATQAAIRAGYSEGSAYSIGSENMSKPEIQAQVQKLFDKRSDRIEITGDKVLQELAKMAFVNMDDFITINDEGEPFVDLSKLTRKQAAAIQEVTVDQYTDVDYDDEGNKIGRPVKKIKFKLSDKKANLDLLGKHLKLFGADSEMVNNIKVVMPSITIDGKKLEYNLGTPENAEHPAETPAGSRESG